MRVEIIQTAEKLFFSNGYRATSLQEIGDVLNIKAASLYHHFPGGKEEIYLEVLKSRLSQYKEQVHEMSARSQKIEDFLRAFAIWYIAQPPMNMQLIAQMDMPHLSEKGKITAMGLVSSSIFAPLREALEKSKEDLRNFDSMRLVGIYLALLGGMSFAVKQGYTEPKDAVEDFIEMMMRGILK